MKRFIVDPIRTVVTIVVALLATGWASATVMVIGWMRPDSPMIDRVLRRWSRIWLAVGGVTLHIEGGEHVDPSRSYVVVSNHRSNFDIMVNFLAVDLPIRFLAKKELFALPLVGAAMRAIGMVEVDRHRGGLVHTQLNSDAGEAVAHARSLMVYPEGTRTRDGSMQEFKKGAFAIAVVAGLPILPVTIQGSYIAWPAKGLVRGGPIRVSISKPIETEGMGRRDIVRLTKEVRQLILDDYNRLAST